MINKIKKQRQGFTLIEVLAVIVIIAIIAAIAVPAVKNILTESKRDTFGLSAQKVLEGVLQQEAIDDEFEATEVSAQNLKAKLKMSNANYQKLIITETNDKELYIYIEGKSKWKNLVVCGTHDDIIVESKDNIEVCVVPTGNTWVCGKPFTDSRTNANNLNSKTYSTIELGGLCWMAEDLKWECDKLCNENWSDQINWEGSCSNDCCGYSTDNYSEIMLYQWEAAKEACPPDWHLATDEEWFILETALGNKAGDQLKDPSVSNWLTDSTVNSSGFKALPVGKRITMLSGACFSVGQEGNWWSATEYDVNDIWAYNLSYIESGVYRFLESKASGCAVRCVKD